MMEKSTFKVDRIQKGHGVQESKQEVIKVVSLNKNMEIQPNVSGPSCSKRR